METNKRKVRQLKEYKLKRIKRLELRGVSLLGIGIMIILVGIIRYFSFPSEGEMRDIHDMVVLISLVGLGGGLFIIGVGLWGGSVRETRKEINK